MQKLTQNQWREVVTFVATLGSATLPNKGKALRESQINSCRLMLIDYPFIPKNLYRNKGGELTPTGKCINWLQAMRKAPGNVVVPYDIYDNSAGLATYIMSDRATTDNRHQFLTACIDFIIDNEEFTDYSPSQYDSLLLSALYQQAMNKTSSYAKLMENIAASNEEPSAEVTPPELAEEE